VKLPNPESRGFRHEIPGSRWRAVRDDGDDPSRPPCAIRRRYLLRPPMKVTNAEPTTRRNGGFFPWLAKGRPVLIFLPLSVLFSRTSGDREY